MSTSPNLTTDRLQLRPITLRPANAFVEQHHRHLDVATTGHRWSTSVMLGDAIVGVAIAGRPVARMLDDGLHLEVLRLATDGTPNVCSMLYGAVARAAKGMGYRREHVITYTLNTELGASLRAAGWTCEGVTDGGEWSRGSRIRKSVRNPGPKVRWHA